MADTPQGPQYGPERQTERIPILDQRNPNANDGRSTVLNDVTDNAIFSIGGSGAQSSDQPLQTNLNRTMNPSVRNARAIEANRREWVRRGMIPPFIQEGRENMDVRGNYPMNYTETAYGWLESDANYERLDRLLDSSVEDVDQWAINLSQMYEYLDFQYLQEIRKLLNENPKRNKAWIQQQRASRENANTETREDIVRAAYEAGKQEKEIEAILQEYKNYIPESVKKNKKIAASYVIAFLQNEGKNNPKAKDIIKLLKNNRMFSFK